MGQSHERRVVCPLIAGVDEAGRGALAGPVTAAAAMLNPAVADPGLTDSKQLSATRREWFDGRIKMDAVAWALGWASAAEIDAHNVLAATFLAMRRAVDALPRRPGAVWIDGNRAPDGIGACRTVVGGDALQPAISAASILAKVARDREMVALDARYPGYDLAANKGYGTAAHRQALAERAPTPAHRASFAPVARHQMPEQISLGDF
ncbi:ribonuclease HII [Salinisphaera orenii]|uniref:ribonuclease HII n=1 Tax=Salinisphaera orenii TaxID=856731 RepID=UPI000DBE5033